jgi:chromate reductase, NAD(P)H dehydrogenase (quinone)
VRLLALCGSLRAASLNAMLLRVMQQIAPADIHIDIHDIAQLPLFNPDLEAADPPVVRQLRECLIQADGVIIASPEYAHGISGVLKNALDWMVGNESFVNKPVMLVNASPRATHAQLALREVLRTMSALVIEEACVALPLLGSALSEAELAQHSEHVLQLQYALRGFRDAVTYVRST